MWVIGTWSDFNITVVSLEVFYCYFLYIDIRYILYIIVHAQKLKS